MQAIFERAGHSIACYILAHRVGAYRMATALCTSVVSRLIEYRCLVLEVQRS